MFDNCRQDHFQKCYCFRKKKVDNLAHYYPLPRFTMAVKKAAKKAPAKKKAAPKKAAKKVVAKKAAPKKAAAKKKK